MLKKLQKRNSQGFTIIEVMIVLAIAALILLIVLLAVPALQRGSRNTQRKNDVSAITSGVTEFINNNNGTAPNTATGNNPVVFGSTVAGVANSDASVGFFNGGSAAQAGCQGAGVAGHVYLITGAGACTAPANDAAHDYVEIVSNARCQGSDAVANTRSTAVLYEIESQGGYTRQCQGS